MDDTALRPKPMPGQEPCGPGRAPGSSSGRGFGKRSGNKSGKRFGGGRRPHALRRRGRRLTTLLSGLLLAAVLVLSGIGIGTVGATVIGMSKLAEMQRAAPPGAGAKAGHAPEQRSSASRAPGGAPHHTAAPARPVRPATLGVEAVDAPGGPGALLVGVHVPGPGYTAGLVRGDTLLAFGGTRVRSAASLASAVAGTRPGKEVTLTVRHEGGGRQVLSVRPGVVT
ncbi:PDZ domain-containing protein [Streptomyces formicae]|uniref:PDZ domain-containing protein n=1 Tax=Streptomyces formicae TaxID=1616117 RepID=A0A291QHN3_9ACTN|nr:PDZ domain-containing protein [Streptomyces formicae]ATL31320.1 hypothetical protein KY5_6302 [Streptomyces formicae]